MLHGAAPGYDVRSLRRFFGFGELLAFWELWNPSLTNFTTGPGELFADPGCNAAGTGDWASTGALTKQTVGVYEGARFLRTTFGATGFTRPNPPNVAIGTRCLLVGAYKTAGITDVAVSFDDGATVTALGTSAVWKPFAVEGTAGATAVRFYGYNVGTLDLDALLIVELPGIVRCPNILNPGTYDLDFPLGAQQPWLHPTAWLGAHPAAQFDGVGHYGTFDAAAAEFSGSGSEPLSMLFTFKHDNTARYRVLGSFGRVASMNPLVQYRLRNDHRHELRRSDDTGANNGKFSAAVVDASEHVGAYDFNGTDGTMFEDGVRLELYSNLQLANPMTLDMATIGALGRAGAYSLFYGGLMREAALVRLDAEPQVTAFSRRMMTRNFLP